jgi:nucleoside-diphosphate-sugar epimerase
VVFASSSAVYGDEPVESKARKPKHEKLPPNPLSPYGLSKLVGEHYCRLFSGLYGLATHSLRYFNVFGPRQDPRSEYAAVIPKFVSTLLADRSPTIFGDGKQSRDFVYVGDVVQANLRACHLTGSAGEVFNVAMGRAYTLLQLLRTIQKITEKDILPVFAPPRPGDIRHSRAATQKIQRMLGYRPQCDFQQGLEKTVEFLAAASAPRKNKAFRSSSGKTIKPL